MSSSWISWIILATVLLWVLLKRLSLVSAGSVRPMLQSGALVLDVRSPAEFRSGHLQSAINMPLGELEEMAARELKDKDRTLLLHCLSGTRSGIARRLLKSRGYTHVYNLGSINRARRLVEPGA